MNSLDALLVPIAWGVAALWTLVAGRGLLLSHWSRFLRPDPDIPPLDGPFVDVIVPARNEERHLDSTLECLRNQAYPTLRITVVDDQSTDRTAAIVEEHSRRDCRVRLVRGVERPGGWVGKTWAIHQGVELASADWLWLVDADMEIHPQALTTAWREAERNRADMISLLGRPQCESFWQGTIATALLLLLFQLYPLRRVNRPGVPTALAHGAFVLIRRQAYERAGGMAAIRGEIVEDIRFAERVKRTGGMAIARTAPDLSRTHMYGTFGDIWRGLRKNAYAGMDYAPHKYITGVVLGLSMLWVPLASLAIGLWDRASPGPARSLALAGLGGWIAQSVAAAPLLVFLNLPFWFGFSLPAGGTAYVAIATASVWHFYRGRVLWKDRAFEVQKPPVHPGL
jgi:cellulose synthase/poly-beta-1,6-N-acetylglucosamine synthase-like glycosyltransferase